MSDRHIQRHSYGITSKKAPWRRAAKPLAILFTIQLSGIGCAARAPELPEPTRPDEMAPYLTVYEDQLEQAGISSAEVQDYLGGQGQSPLAADEGDPAEDELNTAAAQRPVSEDTFKVIDGVAEYRIGPRDVVQITTFLGPETPVSNEYRVQADGSIFVSRFDIGTVQAAGLTPTELTRVLSDAFRQYVPGGYVEARMTEYNAYSATLTGQIRESTGEQGPGNYVLDGRVTLSDFVYSHGGPTDQADIGDVRILRDGSEISVDLASILDGRADDVPLLSGDLVSVPSISEGSSRYVIFGEVANPGVYNYTTGTTILDAVAQAGGYTDTAKRSAAYISRPNEVIPVDIDVALGAGLTQTVPEVQPGDFVVVPFSPDRSQLIRDWVGIFSVILSALTIIELVRRD